MLKQTQMFGANLHEVFFLFLLQIAVDSFVTRKTCLKANERNVRLYKVVCSPAKTKRRRKNDGKRAKFRASHL